VHPDKRYRRVTNATLLLANDASYAFVVAINPGTTTRRIAVGQVRVGHRTIAVRPFYVAPGGARIIAVGFSIPTIAKMPVPPRGTPPPFRDPGGTAIANAHLRLVFAPFAGARVAELSDGAGNAATSIGLLRDATDPQPPISLRDYIASYTHPLAAGTFNRTYVCNRLDVLTTARVSCSYDAPDVPDGGATFRRTLTLSGQSSLLTVTEEFQPHLARSTAQLVSISGFAFVAGDTVLRASDGNGLGILHHDRLTILRWRSGDVAHQDLRRTRGAMVVTLTFARRSVELRLGLETAANGAEAHRLLDAKEP
jgi:hypothetical protein